MTAKNKLFMFRLTAGELMALDIVALLNGRSKSDYIRNQISIRAGEAIPDSVFIEILLERMSKHPMIMSSKFESDVAKLKRLRAEIREARISKPQEDWILLKWEAEAVMAEFLQEYGG